MKINNHSQSGIAFVWILIAAAVIIGGGIWAFTFNEPDTAKPTGFTEEPLDVKPNCATTQILCVAPLLPECINDEWVCVTPVEEKPATTKTETKTAPAKTTTTSGGGTTQTNTGTGSQTTQTTGTSSTQPTSTTTSQTATTTTVSATTSIQVEPQEYIVKYTNSGFSPATLTIKLSGGNTKVTFVNDSDINMWVASDPHPTHWMEYGFDQHTGVSKYASWTYEFNKIAKTYPYHNHFAPDKTGTIIVE